MGYLPPHAAREDGMAKRTTKRTTPKKKRGGGSRGFYEEIGRRLVPFDARVERVEASAFQPVDGRSERLAVVTLVVPLRAARDMPVGGKVSLIHEATYADSASFGNTTNATVSP
jgi:hypothetical protein